MKTIKKIKNIKISPESHEILKKYCDKRGIKIYKIPPKNPTIFSGWDKRWLIKYKYKKKITF